MIKTLFEKSRLNTIYSLNNDHTFVRPEPVYNPESVISAIQAYQVIGHDMPYDPMSFLAKYFSFEGIKKYQYKEADKKQRFGLIFRVLLPLDFENKHQSDLLLTLNKLVKQFVDAVKGSEKRLKYIAWYVPVGQIARYADIYICDREYISSGYEVYNKNFYIDKHTRRIVSKNSENAVLAHKKGELKEKVKDTFNKLKTRILCTRNYEELESRRRYFKAIWAGILLKFSLIHKGKYTFKRKKYSTMSNRFHKRILQKINWLQVEIENILCNLDKEQTVTIEANAYVQMKALKATKDDPLIITDIGKKLDHIFFKYKKRFEKMSFTIDDGTKIDLNVRCDVAEEEIDLLRNEFYKEIDALKTTVTTILA